LDAGEVSQVTHFIEEVIEEATGRQSQLYFTDARSALLGDDGVDFVALVADLEEFVDSGLTAALIGVSKRGLGSTGYSLRGSVALERTAFDMDQAKLARLSALFGDEASRQRALFRGVDQRARQVVGHSGLDCGEVPTDLAAELDEGRDAAACRPGDL